MFNIIFMDKSFFFLFLQGEETIRQAYDLNYRFMHFYINRMSIQFALKEGSSILLAVVILNQFKL